MFTNLDSMNISRRATLVALALAIPTVSLAGGHAAETTFSVRTSRQSIVRLVHPAPWPSGTDSSIRTDALRKKDDDNSRHKSDGITIVRIDHGAPLPGDFDSNIRLDEQRTKVKDNDNAHHNHFETTIVRIDHGAPLPGDFDSNIRLDEQRTKIKDNGNSHHNHFETTLVRLDHGAPSPGELDSNTRLDAVTSLPSGSRFKNLELASQARSSAAAPHIPVATPINPPGRGRAWLSVTSDGTNGTEAGAGWTWTLR